MVISKITRKASACVILSVALTVNWGVMCFSAEQDNVSGSSEQSSPSSDGDPVRCEESVKTDTELCSADYGDTMRVNRLDVMEKIPEYVSYETFYTALQEGGEVVGGTDGSCDGYYYDASETQSQKAEEKTIEIVKVEVTEDYTTEDLMWLARIISRESGNQDILGKLAVGSVIMNRVDSDKYPNTIYDVIFDENGGKQFDFTDPVTMAEYQPDDESIQAATRCLQGERVDENILFFVNTGVADTSWAGKNRPFAMTIGDHSFYY